MGARKRAGFVLLGRVQAACVPGVAASAPGLALTPAPARRRTGATRWEQPVPGLGRRIHGRRVRARGSLAGRTGSGPHPFSPPPCRPLWAAFLLPRVLRVARRPGTEGLASVPGGKRGKPAAPSPLGTEGPSTCGRPGREPRRRGAGGRPAGQCGGLPAPRLLRCPLPCRRTPTGARLSRSLRQALKTSPPPFCGPGLRRDDRMVRDERLLSGASCSALSPACAVWAESRGCPDVAAVAGAETGQLPAALSLGVPGAWGGAVGQRSRAQAGPVAGRAECPLVCEA